MPNNTSGDNRYIYENRRNGVLEGYQVRFKRTPPGRETETISQYFSFSAVGTKRGALSAARRWRDRNEKWLIDLKFRPKFEKKVNGRVRLVAA